MSVSAEVLLAILSLALAGMAGFLRLEGRVNVLDRVLGDYIQAKQKSFDETNRVLARLESKIDRIAMNCVAFHHVAPPSIIPTRALDGSDDDEEN